MNMLRTFLLLCCFSCCGKILDAQSSTSSTQLLVLGTMHIPNKQYNDTKLLQLLKAYDPDVILWEQSIDFKKMPGLALAGFLGMRKPGVEQMAIQRFVRFKKSCIVLPYDTTIANRLQYKKAVGANTEAIYAALDKAVMDRADSLAYAAHVELIDHYYGRIFDTTLERVNRPDMIELSRRVNADDSGILLHLVNKYITDTTLKQWHQQEVNFWVSRNDHMIKRIREHAAAHAGKRIIVLTGLNHKYYLLDRLKADFTMVRYPGE